MEKTPDENRGKRSADQGGRIQIGGAGAGAAAYGDVANRALEIAEIEGRPGKPLPGDYEQAREELDVAPASKADTEAAIPEEGPAARDPTEAADDVGTHHENVEPDDEAANSERLVNEGVEEADHERMLEARRNESGE